MPHMHTQSVRTRMAPSPTGEIHVGSMAILLKNYAYAKKHGGSFLLRIEDTDQERKVEGAVERMLATIKAYGLTWDEGPDCGGPFAPYVQSERLDIYRKYAEQLVENHKAYYCFCSRERLEELRDAQRAAQTPPKYDKHCRFLSSEEVAHKRAAGESCVIRLAVPENQTITFNDVIRGEISFASSEIDDQVLIKSDGFPTYHLGVVVDDHLMEISHVLRGEEWISSTPKHIVLYTAFGWEPPVYAHIPVFLNPDGKGKMSKRKGTVSAQFFLDQGYLPEALLNFFMILGWSRSDQREIMTLAEYIEAFDPKDMSPKSVVFDLQKLDWINGMYIRSLSPDQLLAKLTSFIPEVFPKDKITAVLPLVFERLSKLSDFTELTTFVYQSDVPTLDLLTKKATPELVAQQLAETKAVLADLKSWSVTSIETALRSLQENNDWKKKQYFMMLRVACTGKPITPPLFETMAIIDRAEQLARLETAQKVVT